VREGNENSDEEQGEDGSGKEKGISTGTERGTNLRRKAETLNGKNKKKIKKKEITAHAILYFREKRKSPLNEKDTKKKAHLTARVTA